MTEKMTGAEAKEAVTALTDALDETMNRWDFLAANSGWASDDQIRKLIDALVAAQPALDESTAKYAATLAVKLHSLYGKADKLAFALKAQSAGLEKLRARIEEA